MNECLFCNRDNLTIVKQNSLAFAIFDLNPVTPLHALVIPRRHVDSYFELTPEEIAASHFLLSEMSKKLRSEDPTIEGFNIGINNGEVAGQSIAHCHIHLIPRRLGDVENPKGGVRHLIPNKGFY